MPTPPKKPPPPMAQPPTDHRQRSNAKGVANPDGHILEILAVTTGHDITPAATATIFSRIGWAELSEITREQAPDVPSRLSGLTRGLSATAPINQMKRNRHRSSNLFGWRSLLRWLSIVCPLRSLARSSGGACVPVNDWHLYVLGEGEGDIQQVARQIIPLRDLIKRRIEHDSGLTLRHFKPLHIVWDRRSASGSTLLEDWRIKNADKIDGGIFLPGAQLIVASAEAGQSDLWDILVHEIAHAYLWTCAGESEPHRWAQEGYAMYISSLLGFNPINRLRNWISGVQSLTTRFSPNFACLYDDDDYAHVSDVDRCTKTTIAFVAADYLASDPARFAAWQVFLAAAIGTSPNAPDLAHIPAALNMTIEEFNVELRAHINHL